MREIVLDTETTGLSPADGDRIVEIGCLELVNHVPTGESFHRYVNPQRAMPSAAQDVHGLSDEFLADKPLFEAVVDDFLAFVADAPLVIHNASFDLGFLNAELTRLGHGVIPADRAVDTVSMARRKFPGAPASLDALCRRFGIDNSARTLHGALLDAELLAEVYLELIGGRQPGLVLDVSEVVETTEKTSTEPVAARPGRPHDATAEERARHEAFLEKLTEPIWQK
jgi:DNA polymerase-3 subunit epsilon